MEEEEPAIPETEFGIASLVEHWKTLQAETVAHISVSDTVGIGLGESTRVVISPPGIQSKETFGTPEIQANSDLLLQASIVVLGDKTNEGYLIQAVSLPWFEIIKELDHDPDFLLKLSPRKCEELIAGAYERDGWPEVVLTPPSNDRGRDVIATKPGIGSIRIIDQVKRFNPKHRVTANDVRALLGVLQAEPNVSKGIVTTTSTFAPGIREEFKGFLPYRIELRDGDQLRKWLKGLMKR